MMKSVAWRGREGGKEGGKEGGREGGKEGERVPAHGDSETSRPSRAGSEALGLPELKDTREEEIASTVSRLSSDRAAIVLSSGLCAVSPPVGAVVSHGVVIPPWPEELRSAVGTMARILMGGKQIVCTRAEFGMQAKPTKCKGVVTGRIERAQPYLANGDLLNSEALRGSIAITGRGGCPFTDKARALEQAGAIAVVIVNHADMLFNVLGEASEVTIPVVSVTKSDGESLQNGARVAVQWGEVTHDIVEEELPPIAGPTSWTIKMTSKMVADEENHPPSVC